ncbi:MAG: ABC transporter substrate-binding protein, partial [Hungatella sp.]
MKKRISLVLAAGLLCTTVLSACGNSAAKTEPQTIAQATTEAKAETTAAASTGEKTAQEITFVLSNEPDGIDPGITNNTFASPFIINCFEGLVTNDESGSVVPGSAEKWEISPDGLVYTFHLREGLKW